ncbi:hypothetical protein DERF_009571 [Dermatophagoides farinae]|uniref:Uncharacterized protein n=1 Tax=Dermatophagoides farinae TaxID=6954 RepID=A0A922HU90_DERFA|nr:hypothetical protein DERF_009571 [Dermatophagoides farinae]
MNGIHHSFTHRVVYSRKKNTIANGGGGSGGVGNLPKCKNTTKQTKCHQVESTTNNVSAMMQMTMSKCTQVTAKKKFFN